MSVHESVRDRLPEFIALCSRRGVRRLSVFGSAVSGGFDAQRSDIDFLVEFEAMTPAEHAEAYLALVEEAEALFGRPVDLVEPQAVRNPYVRRQIEATRELVYAA